MKNVLYLLISILVISACSEETIPANSIDNEADYYPLSIGKYWVFQTDSIVYNSTQGIEDTLRGYIREEIISTHSDVSGNEVLTIDRKWRRDLSSDWINNATYTAYLSGNQLIKVEDNLKFVKLSLPPKLNTSWDGNQYLDETIEVDIIGNRVDVYNGWGKYRYTDFAESININGQEYSNVYEITLADNDNQITRRLAKEWYAKGVGLIKKEWEILDVDQSQDISIPFDDRVEAGFKLTQTLIEHN